MRTIRFVLIIFFFFTSCINNTNNPGATYIEKKIRKQVIKVAADHVKSQSRNTEKKVLENGAIVYSGNELEYLIDLPTVVIGNIDDDPGPDAIVSIYVFWNKVITQKEHLILINSKRGKLGISQVMNGNMKFLSIQEKTILVETSKVDFDSPLYGCEECKEIHEYQFIGGELRKIE